MGLYIAHGGRLGFIAALLAGMFAPTPAAAQELRGAVTGPFFVSLPDATITAHGVGHSSVVGRCRFELNLLMTPSPISPLFREFTGDLTLTTPSGDELYLDITWGDLLFDPNARAIFTPDSCLMEIRGGTGRFAAASGRDIDIRGGFTAFLDDTGVAGIMTFDFHGPIRLH